jgi:hypothetical protein
MAERSESALTKQKRNDSQKIFVLSIFLIYFFHYLVVQLFTKTVRYENAGFNRNPEN